MERWKESQLNQFSNSKEIDSAYKLALGFAKNIGYKFCAFSTRYQNKEQQLNTVLLNNYPPRWNQEYEQGKMSSIDPIVAHCNQSMLPVLWSAELFSKAPSLWDALGAQGLQHGWSQSLHDDESGLCSILSLSRSHCPVTALEVYENLGFSVFISRHLHALVAKSLPKPPPKPPVPRLSVREIDVLKLAAAGKTADESAKILNLSPRTIHFHIQSSIEKMGVSNKISAIVAAIDAGHLNSAPLR